MANEFGDYRSTLDLAKRQIEGELEIGEGLRAIADVIEKLNDACCGCGWPDEVADYLRSFKMS